MEIGLTGSKAVTRKIVNNKLYRNTVLVAKWHQLPKRAAATAAPLPRRTATFPAATNANGSPSAADTGLTKEVVELVSDGMGDRKPGSPIYFK